MGSKSQVAGFKYYMPLHFVSALCRGPTASGITVRDCLFEIRMGERTGWTGAIYENGTITINAPELFGGDEAEGGIVGQADVMFGAPDQAVNAYLAAEQGDPQSAHRGLFSLVWKGGQVCSNSPYLKPWAFARRRITGGWYGECWYPEKAPIPLDAGSSTGGGVGVPSGFGYNLGQRALVTSPPLGPSSSFTVEIAEAYAYDYEPMDQAYWFWRPNESGLFYVKESLVSNETAVLALIDDGWQVGETALIRFNSGALFVVQLTTDETSPSAPDGYEWTLDTTPIVSSLGTVHLWQAPLDIVGENNPSVGTDTGARYCMNPAHIVYQCLTDPNCLGYPTAVIDEANFAAAADQLYAEGLGLNLKWTNRETIENFIGIVCDHAGMIVVRDRRTGLYKLRLLRDDYEIEDLRVFTPSNSRILSAQRPSPADFVNELQVTYTDYKTFKEATVPVRDVAAIQAMGRVVSKSHSLTGLPTESLAARCGERDLGAMAKPLWRIDMAFLRDADDLEPGEPFLLDYPPSEIFPDGLYLVLRVADEINYGTAAAGEITAKCVQDVFSLPATANTGSLPDIDDGSPGDPEPAVAQAFEVPYRDLLLAMGQTDVAALEDDAGYVALVAKRPGRGYRGFGMATRIDPVAFSTVAAGLFSPTCTLSADIAPLQTVLPLTGWMDAGGVEPGDALIIGEGREAEWVRVDAIAGDASTVTVGRGCADTVPHAWPAGTRVWAYEGCAASDPSQYIADETIDVKALPRTLEAELALEDADLLQVELANRAARPLPPGGLLLNGAPFYEVGGPVTPTPPGGGGGGGGGTTTPSTPPALDKYGNPASSSPGPNGGFADDAPDPLPQPEVFGTDVIGSDGEFGDPGALANWRNNDGSALSAEWSIDSGRLRYHGRSTYAIAVHWPSRMRMAIQPSAGAIVSVAANVQTDGFGPPAGGSPVGATIGTDGTWVQDAASYPVATDVTYSHDYQIDVPGVTAYGVYFLPAATPCVAVYNPAGDLVTCWWDDFTAEVSDPDVPMTAFVPANIDFPGDDLTGWVTFAGLMDEDIAGGELQATCTDAAGSTRYYINTDEIPVTDVGQRIRMRAEVWSNDTTTTLAGTDRITANGVALGIALRDSVGNYYYSQYAYVFQRGDWTQREWWQEVTTISGMTYHALFAVRAGEGFAGGIRDIEIDYTTDPATR